MFFDVDLTFFDVDLSFFDVDLSFAPAIHRARTVQTPTLNGSFSTFARTFPTCVVEICPYIGRVVVGYMRIIINKMHIFLAKSCKFTPKKVAKSCKIFGGYWKTSYLCRVKPIKTHIKAWMLFAPSLDTL